MRTLPLLLIVACSSAPSRPTTTQSPDLAEGTGSASTAPPSTAPKLAKETLAADTPKTTSSGNTFVAPQGWSIWVDGPATIVEAPEGDSRVAFVDVQAKDADAAVALAWAAYKPAKQWPQLSAVDVPDREGWSRGRQYSYQTSPNEKRAVAAFAVFANAGWTVVLLDVAEATAEKRSSQLQTMFERFLPKGGQRESFAGKPAKPLDAERIAQLVKFIEDSQKTIGTEGIALGLVANGKTVYTGGFGRRQLGKPAKIDGNTRFMIASNTKALTTLMLAKLVDEKRLTWETPAKSLLPAFALGDAATTEQVLVKHLICACTGMPRRDMEWILQFEGVKPADVMKSLGEMKPTSKFGELFQYSNVMAAAAGYVGGHVAFPKLELGAAYDQAMQTRVFGPLGMKSTTFDYRKAQLGNFALPTSVDLDGKPAPAPHALNYSVVAVRPAGAAWSTVNDMLAYVKMELANGKLPGGKPYISSEALLARRAPQVSIGQSVTYGMGLIVDNTYGVPVVSHGGDVFGYHSDMLWMPEHGIGAVILTSSDRAGPIRSAFKRKLLEVLFDGKPQADADIAAGQKAYTEQMAAQKKLLVIPADPKLVEQLAPRYKHPTLGELEVVRKDGKTWFNFGEWRSEVATKQNPDGSTSFVTTAPGFIGLELVVSAGGESKKRALLLRDAQHEYPFTEI